MLNQARPFKTFKEDNPCESILFPWGATMVPERSSDCMCLPMGEGCSPVEGGDAHQWNHQRCQPVSQQRHVAPGMSKHQPHFRAHTHPWHQESTLVSTTGGMKGKGGGDESRPQHLPSEPSAVSPERAKPCPLSLVHMDFKHLTGTGKKEDKSFILSSFPVPPSCPFLPSGAWV